MMKTYLTCSARFAAGESIRCAAIMIGLSAYATICNPFGRNGPPPIGVPETGVGHIPEAARLITDAKIENFLLIFFHSCVKVMNINFRCGSPDGDLDDNEGDSAMQGTTQKDRKGASPTESMPAVWPYGKGTLRSPRFEGVNAR